MTVKTASAFNMDGSNMLAAGAIGAGVGIGGRTLKNLWDMWHDRDLHSAVTNKLPKPISNHAQIPVTVTPEEAKELEAQGVHVKAAGDLTFLDKFALGAAGTGAAALGWNAVDGMYDDQRMALAKTKLQNAKKRVQSLLAGGFEPQDKALGTAMKVAEDAMVKQAEGGINLVGSAGNGINSLLGQIPFLGYAAGGGALMVAASAFNNARKRNKALNNSKAMAEYARAQPTKPSVAEMVPVMGKTAAELKALGAELKGRLNGRPA